MAPCCALAVRRRAGALHRLGYRLDKPLPSGAEKPKHGSGADQRRYSIDQFTKMWEAQFHALNSSEVDNVLRGCVGITALNLGLGPLVAPTDLPSNKVYGTFAQARAIAAAKNEALGTIAPGSPIQGYVVYAMLFWSNRDPADKKRGKPDPQAFRRDPKTGEVDMSKIGDIYALSRPPDYTNFDFGFWDESTQTFWHANHGTYTGMRTPEEIYQSTHARFAHKYWENGEEHVSYPDFDRVVYGVASTNVKPEKLLLPTRDEKIAAFKARVAAGDWADAALQLNGFDKDDIKRLGRAITHDERSAIMGAAYSAMPAGRTAWWTTSPRSTKSRPAQAEAQAAAPVTDPALEAQVGHASPLRHRAERGGRGERAGRRLAGLHRRPEPLARGPGGPRTRRHRHPREHPRAGPRGARPRACRGLRTRRLLLGAARVLGEQHRQRAPDARRSGSGQRAPPPVTHSRRPGRPWRPGARAPRPAPETTKPLACSRNSRPTGRHPPVPSAMSSALPCRDVD